MFGPRLRLAAGIAWVGLVVVVLAWSESRDTIASPSLAFGNALLGVGFAVTALLLWGQEDQQGNARLFAVLTLTWLANEAGARGAGALTAPLVWVGGFTQIIAAAVLLRYPGDRLDRAGKVFVACLVPVLAIIQLGLIVTSTPATWEEPLPAVPWPSWWVDPELNEALWSVRWAVWSVGGVAFLVLLTRRWLRLSAVERHTLAPVLISAALVGVLIALRPVDDHVPDPAAVVLAVLRTFAAAGVSAAFAYSALRMKLARGAVADLATELAQSFSAERVRDALRRALADPGLDVWYWVPERDGYVDEDGVVRELPDPHERLVLPSEATDSAPLAVVLADVGLGRNPELVASAMAVSRLALQNAQLQAGLRSQLVAVREARSRLLHAGLEQRRRLERDLHDGAQQRLLAISMRLSAIENATEDAAAARALGSTRSELHQALDELRDLAHGIYPAVLTQAGVGPALEAVVERLPFPVQAEVQPERWPPDVESAAYLIACEALTNACKHAGPCTVVLDIRKKGGSLVIDVKDNGVGMVLQVADSSLGAIRDRVDAMGGHVAVHSGPGLGTRVVAELPCA